MDGKEMALNEAQATALTKEIMLAMAQSGSLKTTGDPNGGVSTDPRSETSGRRDAIYLAALHRHLVKELQK